jgi:hypothetical protein
MDYNILRNLVIDYHQKKARREAREIRICEERGSEVKRVLLCQRKYYHAVPEYLSYKAI